MWCVFLSRARLGLYEEYRSIVQGKPRWYMLPQEYIVYQHVPSLDGCVAERCTPVLIANGWLIPLVTSVWHNVEYRC